MANENGQEINFRVYQIVRNGQVADFKAFYGLVQIQTFDTREEAEDWISNDGSRQTDYTILEVMRNK